MFSHVVCVILTRLLFNKSTYDIIQADINIIIGTVGEAQHKLVITK